MKIYCTSIMNKATSVLKMPATIENKKSLINKCIIVHF